MFRLTLKTIRARKARFMLTALAVVLGVAFVAGTFVLTDTISKAYDGIAATRYAGTDAVVRSPQSVDRELGGSTRGTISASVLEQVRHVDGVAAAEPSIEGVARIVGRNGRLLDESSEQATPIAMAWQADSDVNPLRLVAGHAPRADNEIVIDRASAEVGSFHAGDAVTVLAGAGTARYVVAGIATYGTAGDAGGASVVAFTPAAATAAIGEAGRIDAVQLVGSPGVSQSDVVARVSAALHDPALQVVTGAAVTSEAITANHDQMAFLSTFLMVFAVVALVVGGFVIFNAFSITVAQRTKETAMLRALGSTRRQVLRMVVLEAAVVGVIASAVGTVFGIGLAAGLRMLLEGFGTELPQGATVVAGRTIVVSMVVGIVVTVFAAYLPARKASKVAPIAALRDVAVDSSGYSVKRVVFGTITTAIGVLLLVAGAGSSAAAPVAAGALAVFIGVVVLGPVVGPRFTSLVGAPVAALRGMTGVLARDNASRNPKRTAATASALMIGAALVVFISVFAASAKTSIETSVDTAMRSDWIIDSVQQQDGLSPTVAPTVDALPETGSVTTVRYAPVDIGGEATQVASVDPANVGDHLDIGILHGAVRDLGDHGVGVYQKVATANGWRVGQDVVLTFPETGARHFTVAAVYSVHDPLGDYVISHAAYAANVARVSDGYVFVKDAAGVSTGAARTAMTKALAGNPAARLNTAQQFTQRIAGQIDKMLNLIYVLLFLAVVIALFGITNTLALSVVERQRELGLLRAVGMERSQVRASVRWEAALIALLGVTLGTALGLGFGWVMMQAMASDGFDQLAIPVTRLVVVAIVATVAAVVAAALPARRAARLDVLQSIAG
jgi:putative ABC transport system permease protein